ncbi:hypothetical protein GDO86_004998 [Hymenochirus boettgeri]|uniref:EF-hand domain-containing protein n=1 Tax=Hymenochirus boettgeri TaxID=247094 RepID=A0A8T2J4E2_9PIPI|nr:hypothetical protein GDO86_004998 [Hymenochirus boettgeri]
MHSRTMNCGSFRDLRPQTRGIVFSGRPPSTTSRSLSRSSHSSFHSSLSSSIKSTPDPNLSLREIEDILYHRVNEIEEDLKNAFLTLDTEQNFTVTRGEFFRVIQNFIFPLTESQCDELLKTITSNTNGTIPYLEFLAKFLRTTSSDPRGRNLRRRWSCSQANQVLTLNELETRLKNMISKNLKTIVRSCRLYDYNQNGQIQKHELRRILENYCFKMKTAEYEKLWNRYCIGRKNTMDYKDLLRNLGINAELHHKPLDENVASALNWESAQMEREKQRNLKSPSVPKELNTDGYTMEEVEAIFRKKVSSSYTNLVKAFRAFDGSRSGYVSPDALKSVINNFIFPLPNGMFHKLMSRFSLKSTDKIPWEQFLNRFLEPVMIANGQTIPMKSNHRVNLARTETPVVSSEHILHKLRRHFHDSYPSLKQAFLILDEGRKGKVSRKEMRRIVDCMMFRVTDEQFKELMIILDPEHTGFISYHHFLDLFEDKESVSGHKWLHNTRNVTKEMTITVEVETMEDILCRKIESNWAEFSKAVQSCDRNRSGTVNKEQFKRILQSFCPSLSEDNFKGLCEKYGNESSSIAYKGFLQNLGVCACQVGDFNGVSTEITEGSQLREELRQTDLSARMKGIESQATKLIRNMTMEDVIGKLKDCMTGQEFSPKESFLAFNKQQKGKITKNDFRKVLQDHEIHLDDDHFKRLTEIVGFTKEELGYLDFISLFEVPTSNGAAVTSDSGSNHRVNDTKFHYTSAEDCLSQLRDKLREGFGDMYSAFYKLDSNCDGLITMQDFRHLLDSFMFIMKPQEFERLLDLMGLNLTSTLNYKEFLSLFQKSENDCPPWLDSSYRPKQTMDCVDLACEQAHYYLVTKAQGRWHDLAKTFCEIDREGNGILQKKDLRNVLYRFYLPISPKEFEKLWNRYDSDGKGYLTHQEFLHKLGIAFASGDAGPSKRIVEDNQVCLDNHYIKQQQIQEEMNAFHKHQTKTLDIKDIEQQIKDKFRDYYQDFSTAFAKVDKNKDGLVTVSDFRGTLQDLHFNLDDEQFSSLLSRLKFKAGNGKLSYFDFLKIIDDGRASKYGQNRCEAATAETTQKLSLHKVSIKLQEAVNSSYNELHKPPSTWAERVQRATRPRSSKELTMKDILTYIREVVTGRFDTIAQEFLSLDYANLNVLSKDDFRELFNKNFMLLTDDQFENLWNTLPLNSYGNLKYGEFLRQFSSGQSPSRLENVWTNDTELINKPESALSSKQAAVDSYSGIRRPKTAPAVLNRSTTVIQRPKTAAAFPSKLVNCEKTENKLRGGLQKVWQDVLRACRELDPARAGEIPTSEFSAILKQFNVDTNEEEFDNLAIKYNVRNDGKFSYSDFFRNVMLGPNPQENTLTQRLKVQKPRVPISTGPDGPLFLNAMLRIQPKVVDCWRPMRRSFLSFDKTRSGFIGVPDFKQVLCKFGINLSEDDFFHLLGFFDKGLKATVSYNDFLRVFLR